MSQSTDGPWREPPASGADRAHIFDPHAIGVTHQLKMGRELFDGTTPGGDVITFVCFDHGYGVRRNGQMVPACWWDTDDVAAALTAFAELTQPVMRSLSPPAA